MQKLVRNDERIGMMGGYNIPGMPVGINPYMASNPLLAQMSNPLMGETKVDIYIYFLGTYLRSSNKIYFVS